MSIVKIFPIQDTTLYSNSRTTNTGLDEILEVGAYNLSTTNPTSTTILGELGIDDIRRSILLFDTEEIRQFSQVANAINAPVTSSLRMYLATAVNLNQTYTVEAFPVAEAWQNGVGTYADVPTNTGGASWRYRSDARLAVRWLDNTYATDYLYTSGGGSWRTANGASQEFKFNSNKDINMNVTNMVNSWTGSYGVIPNYGIIVKLTGSIEVSASSFTGLKFYSRETHTIYPPCLELKWDDSTFNTGSTNYVTASNSNFILIPTNNVGTYENSEIHKFRFKTREQYPVRQFTTSSVYLNWQYLPTSSYWAIQDYKTKEMVIDFDPVATKLSTDEDGNFFTCHMAGLEPERSYKILIKTRLATGETVIKDQDIIFKVVR